MMLLVPLLLLRPHVEVVAASVGEYWGSFSSCDSTVKGKVSRMWKGERAASTLFLDV
jgi:hypothetical protein